MVAAARTAYFQAENYTAQTRLLSSLPEVQVSVEQMRLEKWERPQTVAFFSEYRSEAGTRIPDPAALYDELAGLVGKGSRNPEPAIPGIHDGKDARVNPRIR